MDALPELRIRREIDCKSCLDKYGREATYVATKAPMFWPLCQEHAMVSLITGWEPVKIDSVEGDRIVEQHFADRARIAHAASRKEKA